MLFPRSHTWSLRQRWLIVGALTMLLIGLASGAYSARRFLLSAPLTFQRLTFRRGDVTAAKFGPGNAIVYGASNNKRTYWDNSKSGIDYRPQDSADGYAPKLMPGGVDPRDPKDPATQFQGGFYVNLKLGEKPKL